MEDTAIQYTHSHLMTLSKNNLIDIITRLYAENREYLRARHIPQDATMEAYAEIIRDMQDEINNHKKEISILEKRCSLADAEITSLKDTITTYAQKWTNMEYLMQIDDRIRKLDEVVETEFAPLFTGRNYIDDIRFVTIGKRYFSRALTNEQNAKWELLFPDVRMEVIKTIHQIKEGRLKFAHPVPKTLAFDTLMRVLHENRIPDIEAKKIAALLNVTK